MSPVPFPRPREDAPPGHDACGTGFLADRTGRARPDILPLALTALARMDHRGGRGADGETGDGAGVLTAIPWAVLAGGPGTRVPPNREKPSRGTWPGPSRRDCSRSCPRWASRPCARTRAPSCSRPLAWITTSWIATSRERGACSKATVSPRSRATSWTATASRITAASSTWRRAARTATVRGARPTHSHRRWVKALHALIRSGERLDARRFSQLIEERPPLAVRDLLRFREAAAPRDLGQVESVDSILGRFATAAMSLGSLSPEAHEALALAMNRTPARSNSREGGETEENYS